jgi:carnitine 3-dehydrogenase
MKKPRVACIGAGLIGRGWASVFLAGGCDVALFDSKEGAAESALQTVRKTADFIVGRGLAPPGPRGTVSASPTLSEAVEEAEYVQESVFESYEVKRKVFREAGKANPEGLIASSTSSLSITKIQRSCPNPGRTLSVHPLNPVYLVPAVEVVGGKATTRATLDKAVSLMEKVGKVPLRLNFEVPGHVADRLQAAVWRESLDLLSRGVADASEIDKAMAAGLGPRWAAMGPFLRAHLAGGEGGLPYYLEHIEPSHEHIWKDMRTWEKAPAKAKRLAVASLDEVGMGMSYQELVKWRDDLLTRLYAAKKDGSTGPKA